jgi:plasmid stability protein
MATARKIPVRLQLDADVHRRMKRSAEKVGRSQSERVNELLRDALEAEEKHQKLMAERRKEPDLLYDDVVAQFRRDGLLPPVSG